MQKGGSGRGFVGTRKIKVSQIPKLGIGDLLLSLQGWPWKFQSNISSDLWLVAAATHNVHLQWHFGKEYDGEKHASLIKISIYVFSWSPGSLSRHSTADRPSGRGQPQTETAGFLIEASTWSLDQDVIYSLSE